MTVLSMTITVTFGCDYPDCEAAFTVTAEARKTAVIAAREARWHVSLGGRGLYFCRCPEHRWKHEPAPEVGV